MDEPIDPALLRRLREGDPVAPAEFCEMYLPRLVADHRWVLPGVRDQHLIEEAAIEAVLDVVRHPDRYDPERLPILSFLRMAAQGDLKNLLAKERRHAERRAPLEAVELQPVGRNDEQEAPDLPGAVSQELLIRRLREQVPDPQDREALQLMLDGVRPTTEYARVFGLLHLPVEEQRRAVKRHKDRLDKVMRRLGARVRDGGG